MVKVIDGYFFKELQGQELKTQLDQAVTVLPDMKNLDEVSAFMNEQQNICMSENGLQWRVWIVENFRDNESLLICKVHHVIGDGMALAI